MVERGFFFWVKWRWVVLISMSIDLSMIYYHLLVHTTTYIHSCILSSIYLFILLSIYPSIHPSVYLTKYPFIHLSTYLFISVALQGFSDLVPYDATHEGTNVGKGVPAGLLPYVVQIHICEGMYLMIMMMIMMSMMMMMVMFMMVMFMMKMMMMMIMMMIPTWSSDADIAP